MRNSDRSRPRALVRDGNGTFRDAPIQGHLSRSSRQHDLWSPGGQGHDLDVDGIDVAHPRTDALHDGFLRRPAASQTLDVAASRQLFGAGPVRVDELLAADIDQGAHQIDVHEIQADPDRITECCLGEIAKHLYGRHQEEPLTVATSASFASTMS